MHTFTVPSDLNIECNLFMYNNNLFPIPVVLYFYCDNELDKNIDFCEKLSVEAACHVIMVSNMDLVNYKKKVSVLIDFIYLEMNIDIINLVFLGRRWATSCVTYALYYCYIMYEVVPYSLIFIYPEKGKYNKLSYCKNTVALFIDDEDHEFSDSLKDYVNNISKLDFPTFSNYTTGEIDLLRDVIIPCRYVIRPIYIKRGTRYILPSNIKKIESNINKIPKYKEYINKITNKYAEMKKLLS